MKTERPRDGGVFEKAAFVKRKTEIGGKEGKIMRPVMVILKLHNSRSSATRNFFRAKIDKLMKPKAASLPAAASTAACRGRSRP